MSNVKQVSELRNAQEIAAAVNAFKAFDGWHDELSVAWESIREAALQQFACEQYNDPIAGSDSY
ncbi:hypothetical protein IQ266_07940 [filamentous cyanobacterium LEGE 11480]|uniref:Uncharacterized protein n=1 Tax=Romeriopsis navalis LEGE 11480 TaxID=2777977 RepID=A0A928Z3V1_9CYAN|nr:hypothetical protein [Romeriopsis navalis]MBE9029658.1 hypothetical protein [Romeriopsis navalis LEGE 11480]